MRKLKRLGLALGPALLGASLVALLATGLLPNGASAGGTPTIGVSSATVGVGAQGTVLLQSLNMQPPGLGAWAVNIRYNPSFLELESCAPQSGSVCNPNFSSDTVRVTGAVARGLEGDATLASLRFRCVTAGASALSLGVDTLADATVGGPQDIIAAVANGSINCGGTPPTATRTAAAAGTTPVATVAGVVLAPPGAGFPSGGDGTSIAVWLVAGLAGAGLAWLTAGLGAGLVAATRGPDAERQQPEGFLPRMRPLRSAATREAQGEARAAQYHIPPFRPLNRADGER